MSDDCKSPSIWLRNCRGGILEGGPNAESIRCLKPGAEPRATPAGIGQASIEYNSGNVWGQWSADTIVATDLIRIPPDSTLIIDPGTVVLFLSYDKFIVEVGTTLLAVGTETDTILFDEYYKGNRMSSIL